MKCPTCGRQTKGRDHNKRGLRCTFCWARLPDKPRAKRKPKMHEPIKAELDVAPKDTRDNQG